MTPACAGSDDNRNPAALVQAPLEQVTAQVVAAMRALRPQVVLTFDPYGGYGHPDHMHVHQATVAAFAAAGDPTRFPAQIEAGLAPWRPRKLYYPTLPTAGLRLALLAMRLTRRDPRRFGENADVDLVRALEEATPVTAVVDCGAYLDQIDAAWRCHASRTGRYERARARAAPDPAACSAGASGSPAPCLRRAPAAASAICSPVSAARRVPRPPGRLYAAAWLSRRRRRS